MMSSRAGQALAVEKLPKLLTVATLAKLLDCHPETVYRRIRAGLIQAMDFGGGQLRIAVEEYQRYLESLRPKKLPGAKIPKPGR